MAATLERMDKDGSLKRLAAEISDKLVTAFTALRDAILGVDWDKFWDRADAAYQGVSSFLDAIGGLKGVLIGLGLVVAGPFLLSLANLGLALAALSAPGWAFVAIAAAIGAAAYLIISNWSGIQVFFESLWASILAGVQTFATQFKALLADLSAFVQGALSQISSGAGQLCDKAKALPGSLLQQAMPTPWSESRTPGGLNLQPVPTVTHPGGTGAPAGGAPGAALGNAPKVGGMLRIHIDSEGRPSVREMRPEGGMGMQVDTGRVMAG